MKKFLRSLSNVCYFTASLILLLALTEELIGAPLVSPHFVGDKSRSMRHKMNPPPVPQRSKLLKLSSPPSAQIPVRFGWSNSAAAFFNVYSGPASGSYTNVSTTVTNTATLMMSQKSTNFVSVTAISGGLESLFSPELSVALPAAGAPVTVINVMAVIEGTTNFSTWFPVATQQITYTNNGVPTFFRANMGISQTNVTPQTILVNGVPYTYTP